MNTIPHAALPLALAAVLAGCGGPLVVTDNRPAPVEERVTPQRSTAPTRIADVGSRAPAVPVAAQASSARVLAAPDSAVGAPSRLAPPSALAQEPTRLPPPVAPTHTTAGGSGELVAGPVSVARAQSTQLAQASAVQRAPAPQPVRAAPSSAIAEPPASPAARALVSRGQAFAQRGEYEQAAATYERALEIAPADPWLWHRLASVRSAQGQKGLARALARRSNALGGGDPAVQEANASLL